MYLVALTLFCGCLPSKMHLREDVLRYQYDGNGQLTATTFRKVVYFEGKSRLATITHEFDTNGRVVVEYGFNHPEHGDKYMLRYFAGNDQFVSNLFVWPKTQTDSSFVDYTEYLAKETVRTLGTHEVDEFTLYSLSDTTRKVVYRKYVQNASVTSDIKKATFRLNRKDIQFDAGGKLITHRLIKSNS